MICNEIAVEMRTIEKLVCVFLLDILSNSKADKLFINIPSIKTMNQMVGSSFYNCTLDLCVIRALYPTLEF